VLTREEVASLFQCLDGEMALLAKLLCRTGMRLMKGLRLRIKDVDFDRRAIILRETKDGKDRVVMLPQTLAPALKQQLLQARILLDAAQRVQRGGVETPYAPGSI
jgi:integrase